MDIIDIGIKAYLKRLIETCLLVQASRGGGKSFLIRKLSEMISGHCQQIIIDLEGEFVTLREEFPFAHLAVEGGDIPLNIRHAETYARKFMETGMSVIIDLSDLLPADRAAFVRDFLHALMHLPKYLYHPLLVYIDEAHIFCPQDESAVSTQALIDVAARGRKREIGLVLATQRISKLHKDVTAEMLNKAIGRTGQDIDQARAAKELDWSVTHKTLLRKLEPGEFYCYGPAFQEDVVKFRVSPVRTSHKKASGSQVMAPPTPEAIQSLLSTLQDLPDEAEQDLQDKEELQKEVARLRKKLSDGEISFKPQQQGDWELLELREQVKALQDQNAYLKAVISRREEVLSVYYNCVDIITGAIGSARGIIQELSTTTPPILPYVKEEEEVPSIDEDPGPADEKISGGKGMGKCAKAIIIFLASYPDREFSTIQVAIASNYSANSGSFRNALGYLNSNGLIVRNNGRLQVNNRAMNTLKDLIGPIQRRKYNIATFKDNLGKCEREIYSVLLAGPRDKHSAESLASRTESKYSHTSGSFRNALGRLSSLEIIRRVKGAIILNPELLEFI